MLLGYKTGFVRPGHTCMFGSVVYVPVYWTGKPFEFFRLTTGNITHTSKTKKCDDCTPRLKYSRLKYSNRAVS